MSTKIQNSLLDGEVRVTTEGQLMVSTERDASLHPERIGGSKIFSENDNGSKTGEVYLKSPETSPDYRLRVGMDNIVFEDSFNATAQNTNIWYYTSATLTASQPGAGTINFGTAQGTTSGHGAYMRTFQYFPLTATAPYALEFLGGMFNSPLVAGEAWLSGYGNPAAAGVQPADGVWLKLTSAGLEGIISFNGSIVSTGIIQDFSEILLNSVDKYTIVIGESVIEYWGNDILLAEQQIPVSNGIPFLGVSAPIFMQKLCTSSVSNTNTMRIFRVTMLLGDISQNKLWQDTLGTMGRSGYVGQNGHVMGSTAGNFGATAALVATQAGSNTAPNAAMAGLGGIFQMTAQASNAAASGDMIAQYYLNPSHTVNITGKNLIIKGVTISCVNYGAVIATTPTTLVWGLAYGHLTNTLAAVTSGSFATPTTHAPIRIPLGISYAPIGAVIGQTYNDIISRRFDGCPIVVRPGEYLATSVRFLVGTATASQTVVYTIAFDSYFE